MAGVLMGRREDTWRHTEGHGVGGSMRLQAKECRMRPVAARSRERQGKILPWNLQREHDPTDILILDLLAS